MAVQYDTTNHWRVITQMNGSQWKKVREQTNEWIQKYKKKGF
jgi:hypothetical protein